MVILQFLLLIVFCPAKQLHCRSYERDSWRKFFIRKKPDKELLDFCPCSSLLLFQCIRLQQKMVVKNNCWWLGWFPNLSHVISAGCQCLVLVINCQQTESYFRSPIFIIFLYIHTDYNNLYFVISLSRCTVTFN